MLRHLSVALLSLVAVGVIAAPAEAGHRWKRHHTIYVPFLDVFQPDPSDFYDEEDAAYGSDEFDVEPARPASRRHLLAEDDPWWMDEEDAGDLEPAYKPKRRKPTAAELRALAEEPPAQPPKQAKLKKSAVAKKPAIKPVKVASAATIKPTVKVAPKSAAVPSSAVVKKPVAPKASESGKSSLTPGVKLASAAAKPAAPLKLAPQAKTIGCTAGAAVVTGYGFAEVKPKTCTGANYAYTASRGGKTYVITLTAADGEVVDVKKL